MSDKIPFKIGDRVKYTAEASRRTGENYEGVVIQVGSSFNVEAGGTRPADVDRHKETFAQMIGVRIEGVGTLFENWRNFEAASN
jgi:hypothetical protein